MIVAHGASSPDDSVLDLIEWKSSAVSVLMDPDSADADAAYVRGQCIELAELENRLGIHPDGAVAAVRDQSLLAYVVPRPGGPRPEAARLREHTAAGVGAAAAAVAAPMPPPTCRIAATATTAARRPSTAAGNA